VREKIKLVH
jgi:chromosome segregation ATPase